MIIKKYQGKTEAEAMENAKKELGDSIVLMNVKTVKPKGLSKLIKKAYVEITVAKEEEREVTVHKENVAVSLSSSHTKQTTSGNAEKEKNSQIISEERLLEEKLDSLHSLLEQQIQRREEVKVAEEPEEVRETKDNKNSNESAQEDADKTKAVLSLIRETIVENEVEPKYADSILDEIEKNLKANMPMEHILSNVYQRMILRFGKPECIEPAKEGPKVVFFVGTTGVGKTTTIAKIASKFVVEEKKKLALLTADTYRIAASEQLRTYANILEVPFRVIYTPEELGDAIKDFSSYDYILVDTAGHSQNNDKQRDDMADFVKFAQGKAEQEIYLVVSATTKYKDLKSIADKYKKMFDYKMIFTKLDETSEYGNLLNMKIYTGASMSYITCGQNVPEDIETFNAQSTVKKLLGGK
ncbi:MAG: flagellar biosynthesis protein FlhF [Lachnospiraceae bacterium]|nr:flagellar biosynthesis protein FlhF [Lachnospiraceae bacterium]